jgi:hypothetical protein
MSILAGKRSVEISVPASAPFVVKRVKGEDSDSVDSSECIEDEKKEKIAKAVRTILEVRMHASIVQYTIVHE